MESSRLRIWSLKWEIQIAWKFWITRTFLCNLIKISKLLQKLKGDKNNIIITGSGFDTIPSKNIVQIGPSTCTVTSSTQTQIICKPNQGPHGVGTFSLNVIGKGFARLVQNQDYQFDLNATSIEPNSCGVGGNRF